MKRRILLADDSVTIQKVIELTFMDEDYEVRAVSNGDDAVALLKELDPDFVIADVHMPGANGYDVCRRAKQLKPDVPVLLLVGTFEPFDEGQARSCGADSFLKKPFDSQELLQRVEELIRPKAAAAPAMPSMAAVSPPLPSFAPESQLPPTTVMPVVPSMDSSLDLPPLEMPPLDLGPAPSPAPTFQAEPSWGSFELEAEPEPAPPAYSPFAAPAAASIPDTPFDREPSFSLEPDPAYKPAFRTEEEPVFSLDAEEPSYALQDDVFGAPAELSFDDTSQDRYLPEDVPAAEPAPAPAGFDWNVAAATSTAVFETPAEPAMPAWREPAAPAAWELPVEAAPVVAPEPEPESAPVAAPQPAWAAPDPTSIFAPAAVSAPEPEPVYSPAPEPEPVASYAAASPSANGNGKLSDDDVDRIARRVIELMGDRAVRDVAWEVIPDLAEVIIRDRLRELEAQVE